MSDLLIYSTFWKGSKRIKALICLKPLLACANNVQKKFDSLCAGSAPHFPDFWSPTSVCPSLPRPSSLCSLLLYWAKWILTGPGAITTGALWLLQFSNNFSEVRTRTIARSFRWNQMASSFFSFRLWPPSTLRKPRSSQGVLDVLFSPLPYVSALYRPKFRVLIPALGDPVVSWEEILSKLYQGSSY